MEAKSFILLEICALVGTTLIKLRTYHTMISLVNGKVKSHSAQFYQAPKEKISVECNSFQNHMMLLYSRKSFRLDRKTLLNWKSL